MNLSGFLRLFIHKTAIIPTLTFCKLTYKKNKEREREIRVVILPREACDVKSREDGELSKIGGDVDGIIWVLDFCNAAKVKIVLMSWGKMTY